MKNGTRKLAAIMFTDIVGYSALSHSDERLALELLSEHRSMARPIFAKHRGREIKTIGDAFLIEFASAVDAVHCGLEIQTLFREYNREKTLNRTIRIRIGIHAGDIVATDGDVYGDGVNIAARLQYLAPTGGICISGSVFDQVHNKLEIAPEYLGRRKLKNIAQPMKIYALSLDRQKARRPFLSARTRLGLGIASGAGVAGMLTALLFQVFSTPAIKPHSARSFATELQKRRIAVLPFESIGLDPAEEYLAEGTTEELISSLSRLEHLRVLARTSVAQYRSTRKSPAQIGEELGVGTLITGSIRPQEKSKGRLRISVQLIDVVSQENLWSRTFDGGTRDIFPLQKQIAEQLGNRFKGRSLASVLPATAQAPDTDAYLFYLKGRFAMNRRTEKSLLKGIELLEQAARIDRSYPPIYAALANATGLQSFYGLLAPREAAKKVHSYARKALSAEPQLTEALISLAETQAFVDLDWKDAEATFRRAIESNPRQAVAHQWFAEFLVYQKRFGEAYKEIELALRLDPLSLVTQTAAGVIDYFNGNYDSALKHLNATQEMDPGFMLSYYWAGRAYSQQNKSSEAIRALEIAVSLSGGIPLTRAALGYAYAISGDRARAQTVLREMETLANQRYVSSYDLATLHAGLGNRTEALLFLRKAIAERASHVTLLGVDPVFESFRGSAEMNRLLKQLGLQ